VILTAAQGVRAASARIDQNVPTKKYGNNPSILPLSRVSSKEIRFLLTFPVNSTILAPTTSIASAKLVLFNRTAIGHSHTVTAYRITEPWSAKGVTWANQPSQHATGASQTKATAAANSRWELDVKNLIVAMQTTRNYGFQIRMTAGAADAHPFYNTGSFRPFLVIEYHPKPPTPTQISPADGLVVSTPTPRLRITSPQPAHTSIKVQISETRDGITPDFETTHSDEGSQEIDLADIVGAPSLATSESTSYRMKFVGTGGQESEWSEWATYTYEPLGTLTIIEPADDPDDIVYDPSPPIIWTFDNQSGYRLVIYDPAKPEGQRSIYDSGYVASTSQTAYPDAVCTIPGHEYIAYLRVWDDLPRVSNGGANDFVGLSKFFTFELDATVDPVDTLVANDQSPHPFTELTWSRATPPDYFQIVRDGEQVAYLEPDEVLVSGDDYAFLDRLASPRREHTWIVRAVVNNATSSVNPSVTQTITPSGLWLSQPDEDRFLPIITLDSQAIGLTEEGETFFPLNSQYGVRFFGSKRHHSGTITGEILATELTDTTTGSSLRDLFEEMRLDIFALTYLTMLDRNIKIVPFNMTISPTPTIGKNEDYVYLASFEFIEVP